MDSFDLVSEKVLSSGLVGKKTSVVYHLQRGPFSLRPMGVNPFGVVSFNAIDKSVKIITFDTPPSSHNVFEAIRWEAYGIVIINGDDQGRRNSKNVYKAITYILDLSTIYLDSKS
ncbi:hypothetical protein EDD11_009643 [Mortierella claussenii]|nr:hypothetical protein EDD11_009643 [Mortierella claussenii]